MTDQPIAFTTNEDGTQANTESTQDEKDLLETIVVGREEVLEFIKDSNDEQLATYKSTLLEQGVLSFEDYRRARREIGEICGEDSNPFKFAIDAENRFVRSRQAWILDECKKVTADEEMLFDLVQLTNILLMQFLYEYNIEEGCSFPEYLNQHKIGFPENTDDIDNESLDGVLYREGETLEDYVFNNMVLLAFEKFFANTNMTQQDKNIVRCIIENPTMTTNEVATKLNLNNKHVNKAMKMLIRRLSELQGGNTPKEKRHLLMETFEDAIDRFHQEIDERISRKMCRDQGIDPDTVEF